MSRKAETPHAARFARFSAVLIGGMQNTARFRSSKERTNRTHARGFRARGSGQKGFTIIELMLAMVFVSFILVFMALTIVQMLRTYDKAITMKQINQAGRTVTEDISRVVRGQVPDTVLFSEPNGLLCIGTTVYQWNPLYVGATQTAGHNGVDGATAGPMMVRKTLSSPVTACTLANVNAATVPNSSVTLLSNRSRVIQASATPQPQTNNRIVQLRFVIATFDRSEFVPAGTKYITPTLTGTNTSCPAGNTGTYCAFAEFQTLVYLAKDQL